MRFNAVQGGSSRFRVVQCGSRWFKAVLTGSRWFKAVQCGTDSNDRQKLYFSMFQNSFKIKLLWPWPWDHQNPQSVKTPQSHQLLSSSRRNSIRLNFRVAGRSANESGWAQSWVLPALLRTSDGRSREKSLKQKGFRSVKRWGRQIGKKKIGFRDRKCSSKVSFKNPPYDNCRNCRFWNQDPRQPLIKFQEFFFSGHCWEPLLC